MNINDLFNEFLLNILNILLIPLLPVITAYLITYIKKKTSELENTVKNNEILKYIDIIENTIISSVAAVNQLYVDEIKDVNSILFKSQQEKAITMVKNNVLKIIGDTGISILNQLYKDSNTYLNNKIDYYLNLNNSVK